MKASSIERGLYRHCNGQEFHLVGFGRHTETGEEIVVLSQWVPEDYIPDIKWWCCPKNKFLQEVKVDGELVPRFTLMVSFEEYLRYDDIKKKIDKGRKKRKRKKEKKDGNHRSTS